LKEDENSMGSADVVTLPASNLVFQFRDGVKPKNSHRNTIDARELTVYENKIAYESKETHMEKDAVVSGLGRDEENFLVVMVLNLKLQDVGVNDRTNFRERSLDITMKISLLSAIVVMITELWQSEFYSRLRKMPSTLRIVFKTKKIPTIHL
jgi:hypothetical protein